MSEKNKYGFMILPDGKYYSLNDRETRLNNNVLVVGTTGAAKNWMLTSKSEVLLNMNDWRICKWHVDRGSVNLF